MLSHVNYYTYLRNIISKSPHLTERQHYKKKTDKNTQARPLDELRSRAEVIARGNAILLPEHFEDLTPKEVRQTLHELRVYQVEREMQNENLRLAQGELAASRQEYFDLYELALLKRKPGSI